MQIFTKMKHDGIKVDLVKMEEKIMKRVLFLCLVSIILICNMAMARLMGPMDITKTSKDADAVCVGKVIDKEITPHESVGSYVKLKFHVQRVLKGNIKSNTNIDILYYDEGQLPNGGVANPRYIYGNNESIIVTLMKKGDGYIFSVPAATFMTVYPEHDSYNQSSNVTANIQSEIMNTLVNDLNVIRVNTLRESIKILPKKRIEQVFVPMVSDPNTREELRINAISICLVSNIQTIVPYVCSYIENNIKGDEKARNYAGVAKFYMSIVKIEPQYLSLLSKYISADEPLELRLMACRLMRSSKNKLALPYLKEFLNDSEPEVNYNAMMGIIEITDDRNVKAPAYQIYLNNINDYKDLLEYCKVKSIE